MRGRAGQPVPRRRVLAAAAVIVLGITGVLGVGEALRLPAQETFVPDGAMSDPRDPSECREPVPDEGSGREVDTALPGPPAEVSTSELYDCPDDWDGRNVLLRGEVVGHPIGRGADRWIQVNDDEYARDLGPLPAHGAHRGGNEGIGVLVPAQLAESIGYHGGPSARGDRVRVEGVFHRIEPVSREVAVISAARLEIIEAGHPVEHERLVDRQIVAYVFAALALLTILNERRSERRRLR